MTQEYKQYATYKTYVTDNSMHADHGSTVIQDSFNQDNDGIDLKGADVDNSVIAGHDANESGNTSRPRRPGVVQRRPLDVRLRHDDSHDHADAGNDSSTHHRTRTTTLRPHVRARRHQRLLRGPRGSASRRTTGRTCSARTTPDHRPRPPADRPSG